MDNLKIQAAPLVPVAPLTLNYSKITNAKIVNIRMYDAPDFVDAFIESATYDGREMLDVELDLLNEDTDYIYQKIMEHLY